MKNASDAYAKFLNDGRLTPPTYEEHEHLFRAGYLAAQDEIERLRKERDELLSALEFYADGHHFIVHDQDAWETVSGEPQNYQEDEANTATVEDGSVARAAIASVKGAE